ncbi:beta-phosphoglucomutase [Microbulbifer thermotolerans]|uniref:beta-phosphoglucomutase n=1 Tax=Microbulbifer thermotolerans TaxID=252514 RepID=UPI0008E86C28|nr:beta-phosphoglucomutase [Microbulbifer thermotolerans]MCX2780354.1 beta-phosphoglucomutase [Microbulbifer thermotolerans]MCX2782523.1 beta-phosphoglucomutase [Microbulbifer thermotolerans]MCX2794535.1 beta-phosphoglucomutase [Microbulbifer thermotolerans]MCX2805974.1 beta-phosphoglucomutase [Microbulbifer thermotolerans]MCX2832623.1 beta-phosphoglucomutase [Microbulbifer thermotolerans]
MSFHAAIFDLDGVIADTARLHLQAWRQLAKELQLPWNDAMEEGLKGLERMASLEVILGHRSPDFTDGEKVALASRKNDCYRALIETLSPADLLPGAGELLHWLRSRHIPIGLASASKNAPAVLNALEIADCFTYIADPSAAAPKPAPDIFLAAATGLAAEPAVCLAFEDAAAGVDAIQAAGMTAVGVGDRNALQSADHLLNSLVEFEPERFFSAHNTPSPISASIA